MLRPLPSARFLRQGERSLTLVDHLSCRSQDGRGAVALVGAIGCGVR